jgi:hypothetical protein
MANLLLDQNELTTRLVIGDSLFAGHWLFASRWDGEMKEGNRRASYAGQALELILTRY